MKCPHCKTDMVRPSREGLQMVKTRGLVLKSDGIYLICPHCKADVAASAEVLKTLHIAAGLYLSNPGVVATSKS